MHEDAVHTEELGEVVNVTAAGDGGDMIVRPMEITPLWSRNFAGVEVNHIDQVTS